MENKEEHYLPIDQVLNLPKVKEMVPDIQDQLLSGEYDILKAHIFFRKIGSLAEKILEGEKGKKIKEALEEEVRKYKEGSTARVFNVEIREQNRSYWDYSECNDPIWDELTRIEKEVKDLLKTREKELQLQIPAPGFGISECKIAVPYFPTFKLEENTDLAIINPPYEGSKTIFAYYL